MKNLTIKNTTLALATFALLSPAFAQKAAPAKAVPAKAETAKKVEVDTASSKLKWVGKKVTGQHDGAIALKSGSFELAGSEIKGGTFEIDMKSITVADIKDAETNGKLVGHLKNDDFFGVDKHPTASIKVKSLKALAKPEAGKTSHEVVADLTIKGKTHPVTFPALIETKDGIVKAKATVTIDRTKYDVKYGSGKFFKGLGDKMINDEFTVELDLSSKAIAKVASN